MWMAGTTWPFFFCVLQPATPCTTFTTWITQFEKINITALILLMAPVLQRLGRYMNEPQSWWIFPMSLDGQDRLNWLTIGVGSGIFPAAIYTAALAKLVACWNFPNRFQTGGL